MENKVLQPVIKEVKWAYNTKDIREVKLFESHIINLKVEDTYEYIRILKPNESTADSSKAQSIKRTIEKCIKLRRFQDFVDKNSIQKNANSQEQRMTYTTISKRKEGKQ